LTGIQLADILCMHCEYYYCYCKYKSLVTSLVVHICSNILTNLVLAYQGW